ncbi:hypothetical protein Tdes44962_MAKER01226 [Teratosphaeria destructans]|uniref:Uncharacterized protein n=1 Tax=Teratosphaeria destructans TaxID=418781 RepID=A0A9W7T1A2_9PEZI|nr:hypothetical protein Tdes44962_MAKER01226 [Teratosphaeria destructans]
MGIDRLDTQIIGPRANPATYKLIPKTATCCGISSSSSRSCSAAEKMLLPKETTNVIDVVVTTIAHFRQVGQFCGRAGSCSPVQSTMMEEAEEEEEEEEVVVVVVEETSEISAGFMAQV